jgi:hypothetical protein
VMQENIVQRKVHACASARVYARRTALFFLSSETSRRSFRQQGAAGSFARGSLADWAGWLPAREFASRSGAMNLEQVGPLDVHLPCRSIARSPRSPRRSRARCIPPLLPKGTFASTPSSLPLPLPGLSAYPPSPPASSLPSARKTRYSISRFWSSLSMLACIFIRPVHARGYLSHRRHPNRMRLSLPLPRRGSPSSPDRLREIAESRSLANNAGPRRFSPQNRRLASSLGSRR